MVTKQGRTLDQLYGHDAGTQIIGKGSLFGSGNLHIYLSFPQSRSPKRSTPST